MIPISYITIKGNVLTYHSHIIICTNTFTSFQKWQRVFVWENGLGGNLGSHDFIAGGWQVCKTL
jgi:hypothetical protein